MRKSVILGLLGIASMAMSAQSDEVAKKPTLKEKRKSNKKWVNKNKFTNNK